MNCPIFYIILLSPRGRKAGQRNIDVEVNGSPSGQIRKAQGYPGQS